MRRHLLLAAVTACGTPAHPYPPTPNGPSAVASTPGAAPARESAGVGSGSIAETGPAPDPAHGSYADLPSALRAIIAPDARVIGFGELHERTDRATHAPGRSTLAQFTAAMTVLGDQVSDLIVETWVVDPRCGKPAVEASATVQSAARRPEATKSEITLLAEAARNAKVQPHAMTLSCDDYKRIVKPPAAGASADLDAVAMLTITTRELTRIATSAVAHRDREPAHRPWIVVYGGALHNDRFPDPATAEWSYAAAVDAATHKHFVEIDLISPELAVADEQARKRPWYAAAEHADRLVHVVEMGERSFAVILPRSP